MTINRGFKGIGLFGDVESSNLSLQGKFTKNEALYLAQANNWQTSSPFIISMLAVGGGGGAGGTYLDVPMGGGAGAAVSANYDYTPEEILYIEVGGGGRGGGDTPGKVGGYNGGGDGGDAGGYGAPGGGGGGWSGIYKDPDPRGITHPNTNFLIVAGGGAGGGGSSAGPANDVIAQGGGQQNNYNPAAANLTGGGSFFGNTGFPYGAVGGDGGGWGGGGGGRWGGETKPHPATGPSVAYGGGNYLGPNVTNTGVVNGSPGLKGMGGHSANIDWFGYGARNEITGGNVVLGTGFGRGGFTTAAFVQRIQSGAPGGVIIRYPGLPKVAGGNIITKGNYTFHIYTAPGTFGRQRLPNLPLPGTNQVQYMIISGGGGGSGSGGGTPSVRGGGGAGTYLFGNLTVTQNVDYNFVIGAGGAAGTTALPARQGAPGNPSELFGGWSMPSMGGGEAGYYDQGGGSASGQPGVGVPGTGTGGGGGGMGGPAFTGIPTPQHTNGGVGITVPWLIGVTANIGGGIGAFGGGGGGTAMPAPGPIPGVGPGTGGYGGGGSGAAGYLNTTGRTEALAFTGSGGGASQDGISTRGGSGVMILRQPATTRPPKVYFANTYEHFVKDNFRYILLRGSGSISWPSEGNYEPLRGNIA